MFFCSFVFPSSPPVIAVLDYHFALALYCTRSLQGCRIISPIAKVFFLFLSKLVEIFTTRPTRERQVEIDLASSWVVSPLSSSSHRDYASTTLTRVDRSDWRDVRLSVHSPRNHLFSRRRSGPVWASQRPPTQRDLYRCNPEPRRKPSGTSPLCS
jgi:hypothetical protein